MTNATQIKSLNKADFDVILDVLNVFDTDAKGMPEGMKTEAYMSDVSVTFDRVLKSRELLNDYDLGVILDVLNVFYPEDCNHPRMKDEKFFDQVGVTFKKVLKICLANNVM